MQYIADEIWVYVDELVRCGVKERTIIDGIYCQSPRWQSIVDPVDQRRRLVRYSTLAEKYQEQVKALLCGGLEPVEWYIMDREQIKVAEEFCYQEGFERIIEVMCECQYSAFMHLYAGTDPKQQRCLARAAGMVHAIGDWHVRQGIGWRSYEPTEQALDWLNQGNRLELYFPKKYLPSNKIRLKEKVVGHWVDGTPLQELIKLPRAGNENRAAAGIWKQQWQSAAIALRCDGRNYSQAAIVRRVRELAELLMQPAPSESAVRSHLARSEHLTVKYHTDGNNVRGQRHRSAMPIGLPMYADACWEMDGTRVQILPHATGERTKGGAKELKALTVVSVRDVYSGAYLGYWYGHAENEMAYRSALRMAVEVTGRLPYELRYDRFPGHTTPEWGVLEGELERLGVQLRKVHSAQGKARMERAYGTLQGVFEMGHSAWMGMGIKAHVAQARPTEAYLAKQAKALLAQGWDYDQAWQAAAEIMGQYNHTPIGTYSRRSANLMLSPWELYAQADSEGVQVPSWEVAKLFWAGRYVGIRNNRIEIISRGERHRYYVTECSYELLEYQRKGVQVLVRHDPWDFTKLMVFNPDNEAFLCELVEQADIQLYGKDADWAAAQAWKAEAKALEERKRRDLEQYELPDEIAALLPTLGSNKTRHEDALLGYALNHAGEWLRPERPADEGRSHSPPPPTSSNDFDIDAFTRGQY